MECVYNRNPAMLKKFSSLNSAIIDDIKNMQSNGIIQKKDLANLEKMAVQLKIIEHDVQKIDKETLKKCPTDKRLYKNISSVLSRFNRRYTFESNNSTGNKQRLLELMSEIAESSGNIGKLIS